MLNKDQMEFFQQLYAFVHDERESCANLQRLIDLLFPDPGADALSIRLHTGIRPYLEMREELGRLAMDLIYKIQEDLVKTASQDVVDCEFQEDTTDCGGGCDFGA